MIKYECWAERRGALFLSTFFSPCGLEELLCEAAGRRFYWLRWIIPTKSSRRSKSMRREGKKIPSSRTPIGPFVSYTHSDGKEHQITNIFSWKNHKMFMYRLLFFNFLSYFSRHNIEMKAEMSFFCTTFGLTPANITWKLEKCEVAIVQVRQSRRAIFWRHGIIFYTLTIFPGILFLTTNKQCISIFFKC